MSQGVSVPKSGQKPASASIDSPPKNFPHRYGTTEEALAFVRMLDQIRLRKVHRMISEHITQLEELGTRGSAAPVDTGANNDGGVNQFNRGNN